MHPLEFKINEFSSEVSLDASPTAANLSGTSLTEWALGVKKLISLSLDSSEFSRALSHTLFTRILIIWHLVDEAVELQVKKFAQAF